MLTREEVLNGSVKLCLWNTTVPPGHGKKHSSGHQIDFFLACGCKLHPLEEMDKTGIESGNRGGWQGRHGAQKQRDPVCRLTHTQRGCMDEAEQGTPEISSTLEP